MTGNSTSTFVGIIMKSEATRMMKTLEEPCAEDLIMSNTIGNKEYICLFRTQNDLYECYLLETIITHFKYEEARGQEPRLPMTRAPISNADRKRIIALGALYLEHTTGQLAQHNAQRVAARDVQSVAARNGPQPTRIRGAPVRVPASLR